MSLNAMIQRKTAIVFSIEASFSLTQFCTHQLETPGNLTHQGKRHKRSEAFKKKKKSLA